MTDRYYDFSKKTVLYASEEFPRHSEASIIELNDGSLLMAWQRHKKSNLGSGDDAPSTISLMNSCDNGATWQNERVVAEMIDNCINVFSPSLLRNADGSISLFFTRFMKSHHGNVSSTSNQYCIRSYDEGISWGDEQIIWENDEFWTLNHSARRLSDGAVLIPKTGGNGGWRPERPNYLVYVLRSDDEFKTYTESNKITVPMRGLMEPCIAERPDGSLNMVMRTQLGSVFYSESYDGGKSWTKPQTTGLKAPESCPCIVSIPNSDAQLVIWNNSEYDMRGPSHYGKRTPLTMAISRDGLKTFSDFFDIESDPEWAFTNPAVTVTSSGLFILNYWASPWYSKNNTDLLDLKIATFRINI